MRGFRFILFVASTTVCAASGRAVGQSAPPSTFSERQNIADLISKRDQALASGKYQLAVAQQREILEIAERGYGHDSPGAATQRAWLTHFQHLAELSDQSRSKLQELTPLLDMLNAPYDGQVKYRPYAQVLAKVPGVWELLGYDSILGLQLLQEVGVAAQNAQLWGLAEICFEKAAERAPVVYGIEDHPDQALSIGKLASALHAQGRWEAAIGQYRRAARLFESTGDSAPEQAINSRLFSALLLAYRGEVAKANDQLKGVDAEQLKTCSVECRVRYATALAETRLLQGDEDGVVGAWEPFLTPPADTEALDRQWYREAAVLRVHYLLRLGRLAEAEREGRAVLDAWKDDPSALQHELRLFTIVVEALLAQHKSPSAVAKRAAELTSRDLDPDHVGTRYYEAWADDCERRFAGRAPVFSEKLPALQSGIFDDLAQASIYWMFQGGLELANSIMAQETPYWRPRLDSASIATNVFAWTAQQLPDGSRLYERRSIADLRRILRLKSPSVPTPVATSRAEIAIDMSQREFNAVGTPRLTGDYASAADVARRRATERKKSLGDAHWHVRSLIELADGLEWVAHQPEHARNRIAAAERAISQINQNWQQQPRVALVKLLGHLEVLQLYAPNQLPSIQGLQTAANIVAAMGYQHIAYAWYSPAVVGCRSRFGNGPLLAMLLAQAGSVSRSQTVRVVGYSDLESAWDVVERIPGSPLLLRMNIGVALARHDTDWGYPREALRWLNAVPTLTDPDRIRELGKLTLHRVLTQEQAALMWEMTPRSQSIITRAAAFRLLDQWDEAAAALALADPLMSVPATRLATNTEKGILAIARGRFDAAATPLEDALRDAKLFGSAGWTRPRAILTGLASVAIARGDWKRAEELLHQAAIADGMDQNVENATLANQWLVEAELQEVRGDLAAAETSLRKAIEILMREFGSGSLRTAEGYARLAEVMLVAGDAESARFYAARALDTYAAHHALDHPMAIVAKLLSEIANTGSGAVIGAEIRGALQQLQTTLGTKHPWVIREHIRLAELELRAGQPDVAERLAQIASEAARANGDWGRITLAEARAILAEIYRRQGHTLEAVEFFAYAVAVEEPLQRARLPGLQTHLAATLLQDNPTKGLRLHTRQLLENALKEQERGRLAAAGDELDRARFGQITGAQFTFRTLARLELLDAAEDPKALDRGRATAFDLIERSRGRALRELAERSDENLFAMAERIVAERKQEKGTDIDSLNRKMLGTKLTLLIKQQQHARMSYDSFDAMNRQFDVSAEPRAQEFVRHHFELRGQLRQFHRKLKSLLAEQRVNTEDSLTHEEVASRLDPDELLIVYDLGERDGLVFALDHSGRIDVAHLVKVDGTAVGLDEIREATTALLSAVHAGRGGDAVLAQLTEWLLPPALAARILAARRVLLVPDGPLHNLPFELLRLSPPRSWLETGPPIAIGASASLLLRARPREHDSAGGGRLVALGDPRFDVPKVAAADTTGSATQARVKKGRAGYGDLKPLPGTRAEVNAIVALLRNVAQDADVEILSGATATLPELVSRLGAPKYLHLATHGVSYGGARVFDSALILTPTGQFDPHAPRGSLAGLLRLGDLLAEWGGRLNGCELVVLSACRTGQGQSIEAEGMLALPWGFLYAGANSVIATRWSVDDRATALLMKRFYANLWGSLDERRIVGGHSFASGEAMPKAEALHEAKRWLASLTWANATDQWRLMNEVEGPLGQAQRGLSWGDQTYQHSHRLDQPRFWAAFVLVGDPD